MRCPPEQTGSNPNHNMAADVSALRRHKRAFSEPAARRAADSTSSSLFDLGAAERLEAALCSALRFTLVYFCGASGEEPAPPLIRNLLMFAFRRNPSHICRCVEEMNVSE